jgi:hypothetical protein
MVPGSLIKDGIKTKEIIIEKMRLYSLKPVKINRKALTFVAKYWQKGTEKVTDKYIPIFCYFEGGDAYQLITDEEGRMTCRLDELKNPKRSRKINVKLGWESLFRHNKVFYDDIYNRLNIEDYSQLTQIRLPSYHPTKAQLIIGATGLTTLIGGLYFYHLSGVKRDEIRDWRYVDYNKYSKKIDEINSYEDYATGFSIAGCAILTGGLFWWMIDSFLMRKPEIIKGSKALEEEKFYSVIDVNLDSRNFTLSFTRTW